MSTQAVRSPEGRSRAGGGVAGAGSGTLLVVIANTLPDESLLRTILLVASPSVAVLSGALWVWAQVEIVNMWRDRRLQSLVLRTRNLLQQAIENKATSEVHRKSIRAKLEELETTVAEREIGRIKSLTVATPADVPKPQG